MMSLWDALRMNMMISYQELVRTFLSFSIMRFLFEINLHFKNHTFVISD
ncbi:ydjO [Escherichia coli]|nr:ydjO [Escherichia coli]